MSPATITTTSHERDTDASTSTPWREHHPVWADEPNPTFPDERLLLKCGCGAVPGEDDYEPAWFGAHLAALGAPRYLISYWQHWASILEAPHGRLVRDAIARELSDYLVVMENASTVYSALADLSNPNTDPAHIIELAGQHFRAIHAYELCELATAASGAADSATVSDTLRGLAETWHPGAWAEFENTRLCRNAVHAGTGVTS